MPEHNAAMDPLAAGILERVADGIVIVDLRGTITHITRRAAEMFGYEPDELVGQRVEVLVPEPSRAVHERVRTAYARTPHERDMGVGLPLEGRRKDGSVVALDIRLDPAGSGGFVVASIRAASMASPAELAEASRVNAAARSVLETVTQHLFAIGMSISAIAGSVPAEVAERLHATTDLLDRTIEAARQAQGQGSGTVQVASVPPVS